MVTLEDLITCYGYDAVVTYNADPFLLADYPGALDDLLDTPMGEITNPYERELAARKLDYDPSNAPRHIYQGGIGDNNFTIAFATDYD